MKQYRYMVMECGRCGLQYTVEVEKVEDCDCPSCGKYAPHKHRKELQ